MARKQIPVNLCGEMIRKHRTGQGIKQVELAAALAVDYGITMAQSDISEIERGFRGVKDFELYCLSRILGVDLIHCIKIPPHWEDTSG